MHFVETGALGINDSAVPLANLALKQFGENYTIEELYSPMIVNVTIHDLLSMSSGISEYSDTAVRLETELEPLHDITPQEYVNYKWPVASVQFSTFGPLSCIVSSFRRTNRCCESVTNYNSLL